MKARTATYAEFEVFVKLRVADRVALTAFQTLRERLGFGEILHRLERQDYFRLAVTGDDDDAPAYVNQMVADTAVFANPTKETFTVARSTRPLSEGERHVALVYPRESLYDEKLLRRLALDLGYDRVIAAGRGVAWTIELAPGADAHYVEDILVARERSRGLLANPHAEQYELV